MSVITMFRKEALRNQYKSSDIGGSVINNPPVLSTFIYILLGIFFVGLISVNSFSFSVNKYLEIKSSAENYTPLVYDKVMSVNDFYVKNGEAVSRDEALVSISILDNESTFDGVKSKVIRSPVDGFFFHTKIDENVLKPFEPLGYVLNTTGDDELSFWVSDKGDVDIKANDKVKLIIGGEVVEGSVTIVVGNNSLVDDKKLYIKIHKKHYGCLLYTSPSPRD